VSSVNGAPWSLHKENTLVKQPTKRQRAKTTPDAVTKINTDGKPWIKMNPNWKFPLNSCGVGIVAAAIFAICGVAGAQTAQPGTDGTREKPAAAAARPDAAIGTLSLLGVAHVGIQVSDLEKSRDFYHKVLGLEEAFDLRGADGRTVDAAYFKINDQEFIVLFPGLQPEQPSPIRYVGVYVEDIEKLHAALLERGARPGPVGKGRDGNPCFSIPSPPGTELTSLDFVQYTPGALQSASAGKAPGDRQMSTLINHVGFVAGDLDLATKFFVETLGFREDNAKKKQDGTVYAVHLTLPGASGQYFELSARPSRFDRHEGGIKAHICLVAPNAAAAYQMAADRGGTLEPVQTTRGKVEKFPFLLFDPDHSRIEFMPRKAAR